CIRIGDLSNPELLEERGRDFRRIDDRQAQEPRTRQQRVACLAQRGAVGDDANRLAHDLQPKLALAGPRPTPGAALGELHRVRAEVAKVGFALLGEEDEEIVAVQAIEGPGRPEEDTGAGQVWLFGPADGNVDDAILHGPLGIQRGQYPALAADQDAGAVL